MKKLIFTLSLLLLPLLASADVVEIDGLYYNLISKGGINIAEVTKNPNGYNITGSLVIPASITYDGEEYSVTRIVDSKESGYWNGVFANCNMTSVSLPESLTRIGQYAFAGCGRLNDFTIPNGVKEIGEAAFYNSSITSISIPSSMTTIENHAFGDCHNLNSIYISDLEAWCKIVFKGSPFEGTLSADYTDYHLYLNGEEIKDLVIPDNVKSIGTTFYGCIGLTSVIIPEGITSIGYGAFWGCRNLVSIVIPKTVTSIGSAAFLFCSSLTSVHITDLESWCHISFGDYSNSNPLSYAHHLFLNGEEIKNLVIPSSITNIKSLAFYGCSDFTAITITSNVTSIGSEAFSGCSNIRSLLIGESINFIGSKAFANCRELADVYCYAENVPIMTDFVFSWTDIFEDSYTEYATLHVPAESIEKYKTSVPWKDFKSIVKIGAPEYNLIYMVDGEIYKSYKIVEGENITPGPTPTKEGYTFSGWSEIPETMPAHDVTITGTFIINKYKLTYMVDGEEYKSYDIEYGATITPEAWPTKEGYTFSGWSDIPETMPAHDVVVTGTFIQNEQTTEFTVGDVTYDITGEGTVTIVSSNQKGDVEIQSTIDINGQSFYVTAIGDYAFKDNQYILSVIIPNGVNSIGYFAFGGCSKMTSITIPNSVNTIGESAFQGCSSLISVDIPYGISSIKRGTFHGCSSLESVVLPNSVTSIVGGAFSYCSSLTNIEIPEGVLSIESGTFFECNGLTSVLIPNSVTSIGDNAFYGCSSLSSIEIPSSVSSIGYAAFAHCKSLTSFQIPDGVTTIENNVFACCSSLEAITIPNDVVSIGNFAFTQCENLKHINMPSNLTSIGNGAFYRCSSLSSVSIPSGVTSIGFNAFEGSNITSVISKVEYPFDIIGKASIDRTFSQYTSENAILYVPFGTTDIYKSTEGWKDFENIIEGSPDGIKSINYYLIGDESCQYLLNGQKTSNPQKGVNIIRMQDGKIKKIIVK